MAADFETFPSELLASHLRRFYGEVRTHNGQVYAKRSLVSIRSAIYRYLTGPPHNVNYNILTDTPFTPANNVLVGQCRMMKATGKDVSCPHPPIEPADMKKMYDSEILANSDPVSLQRKVFFELLLHFGRRGREGLRSLKKTDIIFQHDSEGREYATLSSNSLEKNHQGFSSREREHVQLMYATGTDSCPVSSLKLYLSKLINTCPHFFQRPLSCWKSRESWYGSQPLGVNTLSNMMSNISDVCNLSKRYTNHSIRATTVTTLRDIGMEPSDIIAVTGHRNVQSLEHYSRGPNSATRSVMSKALSVASTSGQIPSLPDIKEQEHQAVCPNAPPSISDAGIVATTNSTTKNDVTIAASASVFDVTKSLFSHVVFNNSNITVNVYPPKMTNDTPNLIK